MIFVWFPRLAVAETASFQLPGNTDTALALARKSPWKLPSRAMLPKASLTRRQVCVMPAHRSQRDGSALQEGHDSATHPSHTGTFPNSSGHWLLRGYIESEHCGYSGPSNQVSAGAKQNEHGLQKSEVTGAMFHCFMWAHAFGIRALVFFLALASFAFVPRLIGGWVWLGYHGQLEQLGCSEGSLMSDHYDHAGVTSPTVLEVWKRNGRHIPYFVPLMVVDDDATDDADVVSSETSFQASSVAVANVDYLPCTGLSVESVHVRSAANARWHALLKSCDVTFMLQLVWGWCYIARIFREREKVLGATSLPLDLVILFPKVYQHTSFISSVCRLMLRAKEPPMTEQLCFDFIFFLSSNSNTMTVPRHLARSTFSTSEGIRNPSALCHPGQYQASKRPLLVQFAALPTGPCRAQTGRTGEAAHPGLVRVVSIDALMLRESQLRQVATIFISHYRVRRLSHFMAMKPFHCNIAFMPQSIIRYSCDAVFLISSISLHFAETTKRALETHHHTQFPAAEVAFHAFERGGGRGEAHPGDLLKQEIHLRGCRLPGFPCELSRRIFIHVKIYHHSGVVAVWIPEAAVRPLIIISMGKSTWQGNRREESGIMGFAEDEGNGLERVSETYRFLHQASRSPGTRTFSFFRKARDGRQTKNWFLSAIDDVWRISPQKRIFSSFMAGTSLGSRIYKIMNLNGFSAHLMSQRLGLVRRLCMRSSERSDACFLNLKHCFLSPYLQCGAWQPNLEVWNHKALIRGEEGSKQFRNVGLCMEDGDGSDGDVMISTLETKFGLIYLEEVTQVHITSPRTVKVTHLSMADEYHSMHLNGAPAFLRTSSPPISKTKGSIHLHDTQPTPYDSEYYPMSCATFPESGSFNASFSEVRHASGRNDSKEAKNPLEGLTFYYVASTNKDHSNDMRPECPSFLLRTGRYIQKLPSSQIPTNHIHVPQIRSFKMWFILLHPNTAFLQQGNGQRAKMNQILRK
ncbi:uncharacterized protein BDR25DRAFT_397255 [Lindgomyces ingoldianus]|uniref:Uncharacterized protein n=1 Tax=Lindgomyces ingoldianus TaxID=673940 RepID=A0ACB6Q8E2_9PLEO|nr:uncharacterized protein BDR25DRAFT_397255 [Lindgomyces ingoldianus]KAF2463289.1 hypothetical protein BDR25DRAFT_397255 [Lindgomyces ingoldianus]